MRRKNVPTVRIYAFVWYFLLVLSRLTRDSEVIYSKYMKKKPTPIKKVTVSPARTKNLWSFVVLGVLALLVVMVSLIAITNSAENRSEAARRRNRTPVCDEGKSYCNNAEKGKICENGRLVTFNCGAIGKKCERGQCVSVADPCSVEGQKRCDGGTVQVCQNKLFIDSDRCDVVGMDCQNGQCVGISCSTPGQKRCGDSNTVQVCNANRVYTNADRCDVIGMKCENGACVSIFSTPAPSPVPPTCVEGSKRCQDSNILQVCKNGKYIVDAVCNPVGLMCKVDKCVFSY